MLKVEQAINLGMTGLPVCIGKFTKTPVKVYVYQKVESDSVFACKNKQKLSSMSAATADSDNF